MKLINSDQSAGSYALEWDGKEDAGNSVASGIYMYQLQNDRYVEFNKMVLIKRAPSLGMLDLATSVGG